MPILSGLVSGFQKNIIHFYVRQLGMPKIAFQKLTSMPVPVFLAIAQLKRNILLSNCVCLLLVCILIAYIPIFGYLGKLNFIGNNF